MKTGDKIVCVDDSPCKFCGAPINLIKNQVYVSMGVSNMWLDNRLRVSVLGRKSKCEHSTVLNESFVCVKRFRLLDELKNENSIRQSRMEQTTVTQASKVRPRPGD